MWLWVTASIQSRVLPSKTSSPMSGRQIIRRKKMPIYLHAASLLTVGGRKTSLLGPLRAMGHHSAEGPDRTPVALASDAIELSSQTC
jgi:hypothetical protein